MSNEWLQKLKPGDRVILNIVGFSAEIAVVTRVTPTTVQAAGRKFRKKDGYKTPRDEWSICRITPFTKTAANEIRLRDQRQRVHMLNATELTVEQCDAILAIAYPAEKKQ